MTILMTNIFGQNSVGVYMAVNNVFGLLPSTILRPTEEKIKDVFRQPMFELTINNSNLLGVYTASNKNGIIVPHIIRDDELDSLRMNIKNIDSSYQIGILKSLDNAFGNLVLCNDKGAIISSFLKEYKEEIQDILGVETTVFEFADNYLPGSIAIANNRGCVIHPLSNDSDVEMIGELLKVDEVDVSTVNRGIPYISSGALVNDEGGIFGLNCTGPEMQRMTLVLDL